MIFWCIWSKVRAREIASATAATATITRHTECNAKTTQASHCCVVICHQLVAARSCRFNSTLNDVGNFRECVCTAHCAIRMPSKCCKANKLRNTCNSLHYEFDVPIASHIIFYFKWIFINVTHALRSLSHSAISNCYTAKTFSCFHCVCWFFSSHVEHVAYKTHRNDKIDKKGWNALSLFLIGNTKLVLSFAFLKMFK